MTYIKLCAPLLLGIALMLGIAQIACADDGQQTLKATVVVKSVMGPSAGAIAKDAHPVCTVYFDLNGDHKDMTYSMKASDMDQLKPGYTHLTITYQSDRDGNVTVTNVAIAEE